MTTVDEYLQPRRWNSALQKRCRQSSTSTTRKLNVTESQPQQRNPALLLPNQIPWSDVGQVPHVSPTPWVTSQKVDIKRRTLWSGLLALDGLLEQQRWEQLPKPSSTEPQNAVLMFGAAVLIPALLILPSTTPCELWLDACVLHQWTTFQF